MPPPSLLSPLPQAPLGYPAGAQQVNEVTVSYTYAALLASEVLRSGLAARQEPPGSPSPHCTPLWAVF